MGLTKRKDSFYVEFMVLDDGVRLWLAPPGQGKLKRWKVGTRERRIAQTQEAVIKTGLLAGTLKSASVERPILFEEWVETYLGIQEVTLLRTYDRVGQVLRNLFVPYFKGKPVCEVTAVDIEAFRTAKANEGLSVGAINFYHAILKRCLSVARRRGIIQVNPASDVSLPDPGNERSRVLTQEEFASLMMTLEHEDRLILLMGYDCGMRRGEILALTWDKISLVDRVICLPGSATKNKTLRVVPMTDRVYAALQGLPRMADTPRVFPEGDGFPYRFKKATQRLGISDFVFHDTRHCARTNLRRAGVDTSVAMKMLGHKSEKMSRRYDAIEVQDLHDAARRLNAYNRVTVAQSAERRSEEPDTQVRFLAVTPQLRAEA
jgi:integrase